MSEKLVLASLLLSAFVALSQASTFGQILEKKYPDKFDYQGIVDFYLKNNLVFVHFSQLSDFVGAVANLRDQHNEGLYTKFGTEKKYSQILANVDDIVEFRRVVRSKQDLCTTQHIDDLLNFYRDVILAKPFMSKYFSNNFHQYVAELGRLCKTKAQKINALFDGAQLSHRGNPDAETERNNLAKVREASSLLCNFVSNTHAKKLCIWNEEKLTSFKVEKMEDLDKYMKRIFSFYDSLEEEAPSGVATTNVNREWVHQGLRENRQNIDAVSLPIQPMYAACELLEHVYEQSTAPVDILGHHGVFDRSEYSEWAHDWNNKKWLHIERICALVMRTTLELDKEGNVAYPIVNANRTVPKRDQPLEPFSDKQEEQIFQIDFTKTYKSAFTLGTRTGVAALVIGDSALEATGDALNIIFAPIRLLANSIANWTPGLVDSVRAVKYGAAAQRDYYANGPLRGVGGALREVGHKLYLRINKSRFYN